MAKHHDVEVSIPDVTEIGLLNYCSLIRPKPLHRSLSFPWYMWYESFLFAEVRFFACCWHLESDTLMLMYQTTGLHPRRTLSSHSSGNKNSHFECNWFHIPSSTIDCLLGYLFYYIDVGCFLLKMCLVISCSIHVTCEFLCSALASTRFYI